MFKYYSDYYWKDGKPYGKDEINPNQSPFAYKIVQDPYFKRFSIEKYRQEHFEKNVYDSILLDFRHLSLKNIT